MLPYCLKCRKNTESKNPKFVKTNKGKLMVLSKYAVCDSKKSRFIKEQQSTQESSRLLSNLGIKTALSKLPVLGDILF